MYVARCWATNAWAGTEDECAVQSPIAVAFCFMVGPLEGIGAKAEQFGQTQWHQRFFPDVKTVFPLLQEHEFPAIVSQSAQIAVVGPVEEFFARPLAASPVKAGSRL